MSSKVEHFDLGDSVICDLCGKDFTNSDAKGGITFGSKAVCPDCTPQILESAKKFNEEDHIKSKCPGGMSFADWVRKDLRDGEPGWMTITSL